MLLNNTALYAMQVNQFQFIDDVDNYIRDIDNIDEYHIVKDYISTRFGQFEGWKQFDYPELNKQIAITINEKEITFCVAKSYKQYYGTSWSLT